MQTAGKAFKGIQREEVLAFVNFRELKDNTYQDTQPQQTKDIQERYERFKCIIASFDICNSRHFLTEIIKKLDFKCFCIYSWS